MATALHDVSRELREPHSGKWSKGGAVLQRVAGEAASSARGKSVDDHHSKIKELDPGKQRGVNGILVVHQGDKGYKVRLAGKDGGSKNYASSHDAAIAVTNKAHHEPGGKSKADTAKEFRQEKLREIGMPASKPAAATGRKIKAGELKPGMTISATHWQAPKGQHEVTKVERLSGGSRSGGVRSGSGSIYHTAATRVTHSEGHYDVSNNTSFTVHSEAPAGDERPYERTPESSLREMVGRGGNHAAAQELVRRMTATEKARVAAENKATGRGGVTANTGAMVRGATSAGGAAPPKTARRKTAL